MPQQERPRTVDPSQVWSSPSVFATTLVVLFVDRYGTEGFAWHPSAIRQQIQEDFNAETPPANFDKLMAGITLLTTDFFYRSLPRFLHLTDALVGNGFDPSGVALPDSYECAWAISEACLLAPPERVTKDEPFAQEILDYLGQRLSADGFIRPPDVLRIADGWNKGEQVRDDWADDPEMFSALYQVQNDKASQVEQTIRENMQELLEQIEMLPLHEGSAEQLRERLQADIKVPAETL
jgi:hypothetical protein